MYRIISGKWKAKKIYAPKYFEVRPTTDFAKEALFSILENRFDWEFSNALDLFAGIGSISLEMASRGCKSILSVEINAKHCAFINQTASDLEMALSINVHKADVFDWLKKNKNKKQYEIVFADPPFDTDDEKYQELISLVLQNNYLANSGILVLEHQSRKTIDHPNKIQTRKYGNVSFSIFSQLENETKVL